MLNTEQREPVRKVWFLNVFWLMLLLAFGLCLAQPLKAETIRSFDSSVMVGKDGRLTVEEKILYDFGADNRHGIERRIPVTRAFAASTESLNIQVESASDGLSSPFSLSEKGGYKVVKIGSADREVRGVQLYQIKYSVEGAFQADPGAARKMNLVWPITGNSWSVPIQHASVMVYSGDSSLFNGAKIYGQCGKVGKLKTQYAKATGNSFIIDTSCLSPGEGLELAMSLPAGAVPEVSQWQKFSWQAQSVLAPSSWISSMSPSVLFSMLVGLACLLFMPFYYLGGGAYGHRYGPGYHNYGGSGGFDSGSGGFDGGSGGDSGGGSSW